MEQIPNAHPDDEFPRTIEGLPPAHPPEAVTLGDGERYRIRIAPVAKRIGNQTVRMLAYNGSVPGPTLFVRQGTKVVIEALNEGDHDTTIHWHGLRLDNRSDGTPLTQAPMPIGGSFTYPLEFPDPGVYWYHPHVREDYGQEMGLYGNIVVEPSDPEYWPPVDREVALTLDDVLMEDGQIAPFRRSTSSHTAMGRFGNVMLVNGESAPCVRARTGEVVRLYLTGTANTRVFNVAVPGALMKRVGGDSGRYEREEIVASVIVSPSEREVVDLLFERPGRFELVHRTPGRVYPLGTFEVDGDAVASRSRPFGELRVNADMTAERERMTPWIEAEPDKTLALVAVMDMGQPDDVPDGGIEYFCPMHAEVVGPEPGRCPKCGMKLLARAAAPAAYACPMHPEITSAVPDRCPKCGMKLVPAALVPGAGAASGRHDDPKGHAGGHGHGGGHAHGGGAAHGVGHAHGGPEGGHGEGTPGDAQGGHAPIPSGIEWEDDMVEVNRLTTPANTRWTLIDRATGAEGSEIDWRFRVGERVKIRIVNEMDSDHPMHHPFHVHGAGRFLVLARDGRVEPNLVWKDTVLIPTGQTVDLLLDVTHPGTWMAHCHIAEHHESGMMLHFTVDP